MPVITANGDPVKIAGPGDARKKYEFRLDGNSLLLGRRKSSVTDARSPRRRLRKGDRGSITREEGEEIWAYNDDLEGDASDAQLDLNQAGFFVQQETRPTIAEVENIQTSVQTDTYPNGAGFDFDGTSYPYTVDPAATIQVLKLTQTGDIIAEMTLASGDVFTLNLRGTIGVIDDMEINSVEFQDPEGTEAAVSGGWAGE